MYKNQNINLFICFMILLILTCNSCILDSIFDREGVVVYLIEKKTLSDTTITFGDSLCLNLTDYFELENNYDRYEGHPSIIPGIEDTSVAKINYNYSYGDIGKYYNILAKRVGTTDLYLYLEWWTCDNTVTTDTTITFLLNVVEGSK